MDFITMSEKYCQGFNWKSLSLFKLCCVAFGVVAGVLIPEKYKKSVFIGSMVVFLLTYIPLMVGFIASFLEDEDEMYL